MPATKIFHIGLLVHDIEAAKANMASLLGVNFGPTESYDLDLSYGGQVVPTEVVFSFSLEGPPFLELIKSQDNDGPFGRDKGEGLHHMAVWDDDVEARIREVTGGLQAEATIKERDDACLLAAYLPSERCCGARVELVHRKPGVPGFTVDLPGTHHENVAAETS